MSIKPEITFDLTRFKGIRIKKPLADAENNEIHDEFLDAAPVLAEETQEILSHFDENDLEEALLEAEIEAEESKESPEFVAVVMHQPAPEDVQKEKIEDIQEDVQEEASEEKAAEQLFNNGNEIIVNPQTFANASPTLVSVNDHTDEDYFFMGLELGPIAALMKDDSVNDILINGTDAVYVERGGVMEETDIRYHSDEEVLRIAARIAKSGGRRISKKRPMVDTRLPDGSRVNIIAPPMAIDGTTISIRKFPEKKITLDSMMENSNITVEMLAFLKAASKYKLNVLVSGGTGSGKTTLLNAMTQYIPESERIITIEDSAELQLQQPHVIRLETKQADHKDETDEEVTIRDLVKNALRMRPDRILVGEVRGAEAFDMMQAMNTGHEGSFTTLHANTPRDALSRLENMMNMGDMSMSQSFIRHQIVSSIDLIVHVDRFSDGTRRITSISEVVGMEGDMITMQELFSYEATGEDEDGNVEGHFTWGNILPRSKQLAQATKETGLFDCQKALKKRFF